MGAGHVDEVVLGGIGLPLGIQILRANLGGSHAVGVGGIFGLDQNVAHVDAVSDLRVGVEVVFINAVVQMIGIGAGQQHIPVISLIAFHAGAGVEQILHISVGAGIAVVGSIGIQLVDVGAEILLVLGQQSEAVGLGILTQQLGLMPGIHSHRGQILMPGLGLVKGLLVKGLGHVDVAVEGSAVGVVQVVEHIPVVVDELLVGQFMTLEGGNHGIPAGNVGAGDAIVGSKLSNGLQNGGVFGGRRAVGRSIAGRGNAVLHLGAVDFVVRIVGEGIGKHMVAAKHQQHQQSHVKHHKQDAAGAFAVMSLGGGDCGDFAHLFGCFGMEGTIQSDHS